MSEANLYRGSCHCGAVRFVFRSEEITTAVRCNCSICSRKGAVMSSRYYQPAELEEIAGLQSLSLYRFGDQVVNHYFCKTCGVFPFVDATIRSGSYRFNLGCIETIDISTLQISLIDGRSF